MRYISLVLIMLLLSACGYKPSAKYSRAVVGEKISTSVLISSIDPENTVIIKDAIDVAIIEIFHASLVSKEASSTHLKLKLGNLVYKPIQYDAQGFVVAYRTTVKLNINRTTDNINKNYKVFGTYDFSITANAVITDKQRFEAIKFSSQKAIKSFLAKVAAEGAKK